VWLNKAEATSQQAKLLYQKVTWLYEEKEILRLKDQLQIFLLLATYDIARYCDARSSAGASVDTKVLLHRDMLSPHRASLALHGPSNEVLNISKDSKDLVSMMKIILM
jgi:hypothetical protein